MEAGQVHSAEALHAYLGDAGFEKASVLPIAVPPYTMGLILAKKDE